MAHQLKDLPPEAQKRVSSIAAQFQELQTGLVNSGAHELASVLHPIIELSLKLAMRAEAAEFRLDRLEIELGVIDE